MGLYIFLCEIALEHFFYSHSVGTTIKSRNLIKKNYCQHLWQNKKKKWMKTINRVAAQKQRQQQLCDCEWLEIYKRLNLWWFNENTMKFDSRISILSCLNCVIC